MNSPKAAAIPTTRLPRYYEPLRHPERPGLALTGIRLSSRDSPLGASHVASDLRVQACHRQFPGGTPGACRVVRSNLLCLPGRRPWPYSNRVGSHIGLFRGLLGVHCRCGLPARQVAKVARCLEGFDGFVTSTAAPIATGWSDQLSGRESHPLEIRALARRTAIGSPP
jgi:hypothetical protein